jgi:hypothetical protein
MRTGAETDTAGKLEQYWKKTRNDGEKVPLRSAFKLSSEIAPLLPNLVIMEVVAEDIVFRLVGTGLAEHQGIDITGKRYGDFAAPDQVARTVARVRAIHARPCGFLSVHTEDYGRGMSSQIEVAGFPLRGDGQAGPMMVLAVTPVGRGLASKSETPLFLRPASRIDFVDLGHGIPDDGKIMKEMADRTAAKC